MDAHSRLLAVLPALLIAFFLGFLPFSANRGRPPLWPLLSAVLKVPGDRLNRRHRPSLDLVVRGGVLCALWLWAMAALGWLLAEPLLLHAPILGQGMVLGLLLVASSLGRLVFGLYTAMEKGQSPQGLYYALAHASGRNLTMADTFTITRVAVALLGQMFVRGLVGPVFWFVVAGLPGAFVYTGLAVFNACYRDEGGQGGFARVSSALASAADLIPEAVVCVLLMLAPLFTPGSRRLTGSMPWMGTKGRASAAQGGLPVTVLAWALNMTLGGPGQSLSGDSFVAPWVGPDSATAQNSHRHLKRALYLTGIAQVLFVFGICVLIYAVKEWIA
ncbi:MAG: cobalamin biosynthesis protein [Alphaproteobacteria bacterium]|nr:cobalamin biosynthesis protein [Alphaproteobacteria bacterium]